MTMITDNNEAISIPVIAITGDTYLARRSIKRAVGGSRFAHFVKEPEPVWYVPAGKADAIAPIVKEYSLTTEETTLDFDPFKELTTEELREKRSENNIRKAELLEERADKKREKAAQLDENVRVGSNDNDYNFWTQPSMNHSSAGRTFENRRKRLREKMDQARVLRKEADELERRAKSLRKTPVVKGDAEQRRQEKRDELDKKIKVGAPIKHFMGMKGYVLKVNKKSYTIEWESGRIEAEEKTYVQLDPSRPFRESASEFKYKKNDIVCIKAYNHSQIGQILRVNKNTVSYRYWRASVETWKTDKAQRNEVRDATDEEREVFLARLKENDPTKPFCWMEKLQHAEQKGYSPKYRGKHIDNCTRAMTVSVFEKLSENKQQDFLKKTKNNPFEMTRLALKIYKQSIALS